MYGRFIPVKEGLEFNQPSPSPFAWPLCKFNQCYIHQLKHLIGQTLLYNIILFIAEFIKHITGSIYKSNLANR